MARQSTITIWCERLIEGGWLLALLLIPSYFNLLSSRHFEPDKATTLRSIVLLMLALALIVALERLALGGSAPSSAPPAPWWRRFVGYPLALPTFVYVLVFLLATAVSITPATSFWGSYQRLQGTFTNLSYVGIAVCMAFFLRRREQLDRLVTVMTLASLIPVAYGLVQHLQLDPLPWRGDVVSRVASTMGNSIFVAAYMIMVVPYALYRALAAIQQSRSAEVAPARPGVDLGWAAAYILLALAALALTFAAMMFGAVVRTVDLRFWWVYPGALIVAGGLFLLIALAPHRAERLTPRELVPGALLLGYTMILGIAFALGQGPDQRVAPIDGRPGVEWPLWIGVAVTLMAAGYGLLIMLPRRPALPSRLNLQLQAGAGLVLTVLLLTATFFTQSRGPWIGGGAALFVFFTLALILAQRRARAGDSGRARLWRALLVGEIALTLVLGGFLLLFNLSDAPVFRDLRQAPYIGRMGRLLEVDSGTGLVRRLIWVGDEKAGGAAALILSDPVRAIVGWGPESMFVAYNRYYPPSLTSVESRAASPDRSHQAYLDELINKGILGLVSYLFLLISFFALAWRLMTRIADWRTQMLLVAAVAAVTGHAVEGLTGIPIVSTLMLQWMSFALVLTAGGIAGEYPLPGAARAPEPAPAPEPLTPTVQTPPKKTANPQRRARRAQGVERGASATRVAPATRRTSGPAMLIYAIVVAVALLGAWAFNVDNVLADMRFQQGQGYIDDPRGGLDQQIVGANYLLDAIRMETGQDFYYLSLGRSLMTMVSLRAEDSRQSGVPLGEINPNANVDTLLRLNDAPALQSFVLSQTPLELMSYARAVLLRANELAPLNKDHAANLGRMYNFWYQNLSGSRDLDLLLQAVDWYRKAHELAPQDVTILNEYASAVARTGDYQQAMALLEKSRALDGRFNDTVLRIGDVLRAQGRYQDAVDQYLAAIARDRAALDTQITTIAAALAVEPEQLLRLRAGYEQAREQYPDDARILAIIGLLSDRAGDLEGAASAFGGVVQLQPANLEARQNYTLVLSDLLRYDQAAQQAQELLALAAQRQDTTDQERAALEALLAFLQNRAAGN